MQTIKRDIYVTKNVLQAPIEVTEGTNSIAIEFDVRDYDIPASAAAVAYSLSTSSMEEPNKALADVSGNKITIIPSEAFFLPGQNVMQIRIIDGNSKLISFNIIVKCTGKMRFGDEKEEQQSTLVEQMLAKLGEYQKKSASPYNFKGSCLSSELPASGNTINDTYYCTDLKYRKTWNGSAWEQSSLNEADYEDELTKTNGEVSSLKEDSSKYNLKYSKNILNNITLINNKYIYDGQVLSGEGWRCTDYIPISGGDRISIGMTNAGLLPYGFLYDENKNLLETLYSTRTGQTPIKFDYIIENIPSVKYARFNIVPDVILDINKNYLIIEKNALFLDNINTRFDNEINSCNIVKIMTYNDTALINNKYINNFNGEATNLEGYKCTDYIYCREMYKIIISSVQSNSVGAYYDENQNYLGGFTFSDTGVGRKDNYEILIPNNAYYIRLTIDIPQYISSISEYNIKYYYKTLTSYNINTFISNIDYSDNIYYVDNNYIENNKETKHYKFFSDCVLEAIKYKNSVIYAASGNYELLEEHNAEWWITNKIADRYAGVELRNNIKIIGMGSNVNISMNYTGSDNTYKEYLSPFCVTGSFHLENINIISRECSYCVHDDMNIAPNKENLSNGYYINCNMTHKGRTNFISGGSIDECIGGGGANNMCRYISGGVYESPQNCDYILSYHRSGNDTDISNITITNLYSDSGTILLSNFGKGKLNALISNCKLNSDIVKESSNDIIVRAFNNISI